MIAVIVAVVCAGCTRWVPSELAPRDTAAVASSVVRVVPGVVRIERRDGSRLVLRGIMVTADSVSGSGSLDPVTRYSVPRRWAVPRDSVVAIEREETDAAMTTVAVIGAVAAILIASTLQELSSLR